ncbi:MAG: hypothetical protein JJU45_09550 [Acidimicrobiia bacterium]|nr:hypothetical protein [Acidimicrobiia bacterium]
MRRQRRQSPPPADVLVPMPPHERFPAAELPGGEPDLRPLVELASLDTEVQCPRCGWVGRWLAVDDDVPTIAGVRCSACGEQWDLAEGDPPRIVVDVQLSTLDAPGGESTPEAMTEAER